jgi:3-hydroxyisobutyrate dehydrogenase-like beta-hydroxyacid dehydrogenase
MKVGFIGLGRMGQAMSRRLLDGGYEVAVYNRTADKMKPLHDLGAKSAASIGEVSNFGRAVFTMLTDDAAVMDVVGSPGGLRERMPAGGIHICAGTHSVAAIGALQDLHKLAGQILIAAPVLGRPDVVASGNATIVMAGPKDTTDYCQPLFAAIAGRVIEAGSDAASAAAVKLANNFVVGCAIEAMSESFALVRK